MSTAPGARGGAPSRMLLRNLVLLMAVALLPAAAWADARDKVSMLLRDYGSISRDLQKAQSAQAALLRQKASLDARGSALTKRQDELNAHAHYVAPAPANPQQAPDTDQSRCDNQARAGGKGAPPKGCDNKSRKLKKLGFGADVGALAPETPQTELDLEFSQYDEAAHDWNAQEQQTITALNGLYRSLNDWADRAEGLVTSDPFQAEIRAEHWERYCPDRAMPSGVLGIDAVMDFAEGYANCLKYVAARRKPSAAYDE